MAARPASTCVRATAKSRLVRRQGRCRHVIEGLGLVALGPQVRAKRHTVNRRSPAEQGTRRPAR